MRGMNNDWGAKMGKATEEKRRRLVGGKDRAIARERERE